MTNIISIDPNSIKIRSDVFEQFKKKFNTGFSEGILGKDLFVSFERDGLALLVDGADPELVLLLRGQSLYVHRDVGGSAAWDPQSGVRIEFLDLISDSIFWKKFF